MARFSGALQLTDLDDFITPSQVRRGSITLIAPFTGDKGSHSIKCAPLPGLAVPYRVPGVHKACQGGKDARKGALVTI